MISFVIKRPILVATIIIGLCLLGAVSYTRLPVELIPQTELPMLFVIVGTAREADPQYLETQAVVPLENAIAGLEDIEKIESFINRRQASMIITYTQDADPKYAFLKLQERVRQVEADLGTGFFARVWKVDTEQLANQFMTLQVRGEGSLDQIREVVDRKVVPEFEKIDGVANIEVYGGRRRSIEVILDEKALRSYNITPSQISSRLSSGSADRRFLGQVTEGNRSFFVNLVSDYDSLTVLENVVIRDEGPILLGHVGNIVDGGAERESISRVNGMEAISVTLMRGQQTNLLSLSSETWAVIEQVNKAIAPDGMELVIEYNAAEEIERNIGLIKSLVLVGGLLAVIILWLFLRHVLLVIIVTAAIPISILIAMNLFFAFDVSINTLTLVGLAIVIGMLLDNSIVVLENIHRHASHGQSVDQAVVGGASEVWRAILAATLTTICVFLPFVFSDNFLVQILGRNVGVAIVSTLAVSLAIALLLIPASAHYLMTAGKKRAAAAFTRPPQYNRPLQIYTLFLKSCLRFPVRTLLISVAAFFVSVILCLALSVNVPEELEIETFSLYAKMPSGSTLASADEQAKEMDQRLAGIAEIKERTARIREDVITFSLELHEDYESIARRDMQAVKDDVLESLENAYRLIEFSYEPPASNTRYRTGGGGGGMGEAGMERSFMRFLGIGTSEERVVIKGKDLAQLRAVADDIAYNLDNLQTVRDSRQTVSSQQPSVDLRFDQNALSHFNVSTAAIVAELSAFQGETSTGAVIKRGTEEIDIILREDREEDKNTDDLRQVVIPSLSGGTVPLMQLTDLLYTDGFSNINRVNQEKEVEIIYQFEREVEGSAQLLNAARMEVDQVVAGLAIPAGVAVESRHDELDLSDFYFLILASVLLIYMILASVFESLLTPLSMMITLPLATVGAFWGLIVTGNSLFNPNALIGFLILLGVVVNNGIILIDYYQVLRRRNYGAARSLIMAGQARVRPILITVLTTILGMLPLALGKAEYVARIGAPFAITVIGGLIAGTLFTLVLVPTMASGLETATRWWNGLPLRVKLLQLAILAGGVVLIKYQVDSMLWRAVSLTALAIVVPALTYFVRSSLRRGHLEIIPQKLPITITVRNVVKVYDDYSRFVREWRGGKSLHERMRRWHGISQPTGLHRWLWQGPVYLFLCYFTFWYLDRGFWMLMATIAFYIYTIYLVRPSADKSLPEGKKVYLIKLGRLAFKLFYWLYPAGGILWYLTRYGDLATVMKDGGLVTLAVFLIIIWYPATAVRATSRKLYLENIDINRLGGRFRGTRKLYYRLVKAIPLLGKKKRPFRALDQVSLEIGSGMFGLVGPNGAGKTTLMRIICGVLNLSTGQVTINGINVSEKREELQSLIGYLPQEFGTYDNMTAYQFLDYQALLKGVWDSRRRREVVERAISSVHLDENRDRKIKTFSGGMKQRVGIAQTLLHLPRILVVDEPTAGLDPRERIRFRNLLSELARDRVVIFSTHIIEDVSSSCNRLAVLGEGRLKFLGTPRELVRQAEGTVWQARMTPEEFEETRTKVRVIHHTHEDGRIRVRLLAKDKPWPEAVSVLPTLEDAYLWLSEGEGKGND